MTAEEVGRKRNTVEEEEEYYGYLIVPSAMRREIGPRTWDCVPTVVIYVLLLRVLHVVVYVVVVLVHYLPARSMLV